MSRKLLRRFAPDPAAVRNRRSLRFLGKWLHDPNLWHCNRRSVATAVCIGFAVAFIPLPVHIVAAAAAAVYWRANVAVALAAIWLSNPLTVPLQLYLSYELGALLLHPAVHFHFEWSLHRLGAQFDQLWPPLLLGCLLCGAAAGLFGAALVRGLWRLQVTLRWRARGRHRAARAG